MRVVIADDEVLLREGLARLLEELGVTVVGLAGDGQSLLREIALDQPDVAIIDIKMPPNHKDEGLVAASEISGVTQPWVCLCCRTIRLPLRHAAAGAALGRCRIPVEGTGLTCPRAAGCDAARR